MCLCLMHPQQLRSYGDVPQLKVSSYGELKLEIEPATTDLQSKWLIHYTTVAPFFNNCFSAKMVIEPVHVILVLITFSSNEGSSETAQMPIARAFSTHIHKF